MIGAEHIEDWRGKELLDPDSDSVGKAQEVYFDGPSATPLLVSVKTGLLGRKTRLVPLEGASVGPDYLRVAHAKAAIEASPEIPADAVPDATQLDEIGKAYGLRFSDQVTLQSATEIETRRAEADAARRRADELEDAAREKEAARDSAQEQARGATEGAGLADREATEARDAAARARADADRYGDEPGPR